MVKAATERLVPPYEQSTYWIKLRCFTSIKFNSNINSLSQKIFICWPFNLGVLKMIKSWTGRATHQLVQPLASKQELVPSKKYKTHLTAFTLCLITTSCAQWDSINGIDAIWPMATSEKKISIETPTLV